MSIKKFEGKKLNNWEIELYNRIVAGDNTVNKLRKGLPMALPLLVNTLSNMTDKGIIKLQNNVFVPLCENDLEKQKFLEAVANHLIISENNSIEVIIEGLEHLLITTGKSQLNAVAYKKLIKTTIECPKCETEFPILTRE